MPDRFLRWHFAGCSAELGLIPIEREERDRAASWDLILVRPFRTSSTYQAMSLMGELRRCDATLAPATEPDPAGVALLERYASTIVELAEVQ